MVIFDPIRLLQPVVGAALIELCGTKRVELDAEIKASVRWRPHVLERPRLRAWYLHPTVPENDVWATRPREALKEVPSLKFGVAGPLHVMMNESFINAADSLNAAVLIVRERRGEYIAENFHESVADFIYEQRLKLSNKVARDVLERCLERTNAETNKQRKGVSLEVLSAVLLSQVNGFEVVQVGISNRSQQMDVLVNNRNASGCLSMSPLVIAEAKNWTNPVGTVEYASLYRKLESRHGRAKLGYFITTDKFTRGVRNEKTRDSRTDILVVLVDGKTLSALWRNGESITHNLEQLTIRASVVD